MTLPSVPRAIITIPIIIAIATSTTIITQFYQPLLTLIIIIAIVIAIVCKTPGPTTSFPPLTSF